MEEPLKKTYVVTFFSWIFDWLSKPTLFYILRACLSRKVFGAKIISFVTGYHFPDLWVFLHFLVPFIFLFGSAAPTLSKMKLGLLCYAAWRLFEVIVYHINVVAFDPYRRVKGRQDERVRSYLRCVILVIVNYLEIILWFALAYRNLTWAFKLNGVLLDSFFHSLNLSFVTMTRFGHTIIEPKPGLADILVLVQSAIGFFMIILILVYFISLLPRRGTMDPLEQHIETRGKKE